MRLLALAVAVSVLAAPSARAADGETCQGKTATIVDLDGGRVDGTSGDDVIYVDTPPDWATPYVRAGRGDDVICMRGQTIDDGYGTYVRGGSGEDTLEVRTTESQDKIRIRGVEVLDAELGEQGVRPDVLGVTGGVNGTATGAFDAVLSFSGRRSVEMRGGVVVVDGAGGLEVSGFRGGLRGFAPEVLLMGRAGAERLLAKGCSVRIFGGGGDDVLTLDPPRVVTSFPCGRRRAAAWGMAGDDRLVGGGTDDVLVGGDGRDSANGNAGRDRCVAEFERGCER